MKRLTRAALRACHWHPRTGCALLLLCLLPGAAARGDVEVDGDRLNVTTQFLTASFRGPDMIRLANRLTGELYVRAAPPYTSMLDMRMLEPTGKPMRWTEWRKGRGEGANPEAAMISLTDLTRTVWMTVAVEPETQDVVITLWGSSQQDGVTGLSWGLRGLDLSAGRLVLPVSGGRYADRATMPPSATFDYPTHWEAQMAIWEGKTGGFVVYSRDDQCLFKKLRLSRRGDFADVAFETEAVAPWIKASDVPQLEWRLNAFKGDWRVPATGYRNLIHFLRPPVEARGDRAWVRAIRTVTTLQGDRYDPALLDALAAKLDPKKTLLYLPGWRRDGYDVNYPDYTPGDTVQPFIERAHALGFHVMLHTDLPGVSPANPDYAHVRQYQVKDPMGKNLVGWYWDHPEEDRQRFAYINPASKTYRDLLIRRLRPVIDELQPDALHLDVSGPMMNDGSGLIDGKNYAQGSVTLHRALLTAFPGIVLGGESMNELIAPYNWFAQRWNYGDLPPHPLCAFLFGDHVLSYGYLGQPNPDQAPGAFLSFFTLYEGQGVSPTPVVFTAADLADDRAGMARLLAQARAWQSHDLQPDWINDWSGALFRWRGADGVEAAIEKAGPEVHFRVGQDILYRRIRGANQVVTPASVPGWPAYDDASLYGLDPAQEYWLESKPRAKEALHLSDLSRDIRLTGAQITPAYALFELSPVERVADDLLRLLPQARAGTTFTGKDGLKDGPLERGGTATLTDMVVGGETRKALFEHPAYQGPSVGETFVEYTLVLPDTPHPALAFDCGLSDQAGASDGVTFRITIEGKEAWREHVARGAWQPHRLDLTAWSGQTIHLRLITNPGPKNDAAFDHAGWSAVRLLAEVSPGSAEAKLTLPPDTPGDAALLASSGTITRNGSEAVLTGMALPCRLLLITRAGQKAVVGKSLLELPHEVSLASGGLARPGSVYGSGRMEEATCGGVKKAGAINAHPPGQGETLLTWLVTLPEAEKLRLEFSAGLGEGAKTTGVGFEVRVNGEPLWRWNATESRWNTGQVALDRWRGKTVVLQLVTDALGDNLFDWAKWADVILQQL